jgi:MFS family permease
MENAGFSSTQIGLAHSFHFAAILFVSNRIYRIVADIGFRKSFIIVLLLGIAGMWVNYAIFYNYPLHLLSRTILGISIASCFIIAESWINSQVAENIRGRIVSVYCAVLVSGFAVGAYLLKFTDLESPEPYLLISVIFIAAMLLISLCQNNKASEDAHSPSSPLKLALSHPLIAMTGFFFGLAETSLLSLLPVYSVKSGFSIDQAAQLSSLVMLGGAILTIPAGILIDKFNRRTMLAIFCTISGFLALMVPTLVDDGSLLNITLFIIGGMILPIYPIIMATIGGEFRGNELIATTVVLITMYGFGSAIGPFGSGAAMDFFGKDWLFYVVGGVFILNGLIALRDMSRRERLQ